MMKYLYIAKVALLLAAVMVLLAACGEPSRLPLTPTAIGAAQVTPSLTITPLAGSPTSK